MFVSVKLFVLICIAIFGCHDIVVVITVLLISISVILSSINLVVLVFCSRCFRCCAGVDFLAFVNPVRVNIDRLRQACSCYSRSDMMTNCVFSSQNARSKTCKRYSQPSAPFPCHTQLEAPVEIAIHFNSTAFFMIAKRARE